MAKIPAAAIKLPENIVESARGLVYAPERYFETEYAQTLALTRLNLTRARSNGIANAVVKMAEASAGSRPKRPPISVRRRPDGDYDVIDGNSTVCIAAAAGWPDIPCRIVG